MEKYTRFENIDNLIHKFDIFELTVEEGLEFKSFLESVFGVYLIKYFYMSAHERKIKVNASCFNYDEYEYGRKLVADFVKERFGIENGYEIDLAGNILKFKSYYAGVSGKPVSVRLGKNHV